MKQLFLLMSALLLSSLMFATHIGDGTLTTPYQINTLADLIEMRTNVNSAAGAANSAATANYILMNDINISGSAPWTPIGNGTNQFKGNFNGNGKTIQGLSIGTTNSRNTMGYSGLFGYANTSAKISNLTVELTGIYTTNSGEAYSGGIVGFLNGQSVVDNCHVIGGILDITETNGNVRVGGIVGFCQSSTIVNCSSSAQVTVLGQTAAKGVSAGGVVGMLYSNSYLYNSYATGAISSKTTLLSNYVTAGGLIGNSDGSTTANCYASGAVSCISTSTKIPNTGGIVGVGTGTASNLNNCIALNSTIKSVGPIPSGGTNQNCNRIGTAGTITFANNTANESISSIMGLTEGAVTTTTNWQSDPLVALANAPAGQNLGSTTPLSILTAYIASNTAPTNVAWNEWKVDLAFNNGMPIFGRGLTSLTSNESIAIPSFYALNNGIKVVGAESGSLIKVFNISGVQVKSVEAANEVEIIELQKGFYIVNGFKIIVR